MIKDKAVAFYSLSLLQNHSLLYNEIIFKNLVNIELSLPFFLLKKKKERRENIVVSFEGEISLTMYTSATGTVLDWYTNKCWLGESKRFVK